MYIDTAGLTKQQLQDYYDICTDPIDFCEFHMRLAPRAGRPEGQNVIINYPQRQVMCSNKNVTWICVHRRAGKTAVMTLLALYHALVASNLNIVVYAPSEAQVATFFKEMDRWMENSPLIDSSKVLDPNKPNRSSPHTRSFNNGSIIEGKILSTSVSPGNKRGTSADIIFVDEAQELKEGHWATINPIIRGDRYRRAEGGVRAYIAGTTTTPDSYYYKKVKGIEALGKHEHLIFMPITENKDWTPKEVEELRLETPDYEWWPEFMLQLGNSEKGVFKTANIDLASQYYWELGSHNVDINPITGEPGEFYRFIGIDWDVVQAGTHMCVVQYDPLTQTMWTIGMYIVPQSENTFTDAVHLLMDWFLEYKCHGIIADKNGNAHFEIFRNEAKQRNLESILEHVTWLPLGATYKSLGLIEKTEKSIQIKPFLVDQLTYKLEKQRWFFPVKPVAPVSKKQRKVIHDIGLTLKTQLQAYEVISRTERTVKYSDKNEHMIDAHIFCMYAIHLHFEQGDGGNYSDPLFLNSSDIIYAEQRVDFDNVLIEKDTPMEQYYQTGHEDIYRAPLSGRKKRSKSFHEF